MTKQILEAGIVPELGALSNNPIAFLTEPVYMTSGGAVNIAHEPVAARTTSSKFTTYAQATGPATITSAMLEFGDADGMFRFSTNLVRAGDKFEFSYNTTMASFDLAPVAGTWTTSPSPIQMSVSNAGTMTNFWLVARTEMSYGSMYVSVYTDDPNNGGVLLNSSGGEDEIPLTSTGTQAYEGTVYLTNGAYLSINDSSIVWQAPFTFSSMYTKSPDVPGRPVQHYAIKFLMSDASFVWVGMSGAAFTGGYPTTNAILPGAAAIGTMPQSLSKNIVNLLGTIAPDATFFQNKKSVYEMLDVVKDKFGTSTGHDHDGTDSKQVSHSSLLNVGANDHHAQVHGIGDHSGTVCTLSQVQSVTVSAEVLNKLDDNLDVTEHFHNSDRDLSNHTGSMAESHVTFSSAAGHAHDGLLGGKQVKHADLDFTGDTMHDTKPHGYAEHSAATTVATIQQLSGMEASDPENANGTNMVKLFDGSDVTTHYHSHALTSHTDSGDLGVLAESIVLFDAVTGHSHNGTDSRKISPTSLDGVEVTVTASNLNSLTNGSTVAATLHNHELSSLVARIESFGLAPEFPNVVFDGDGLAANGGWVGGHDTGVNGGMQNFLMWTSVQPAMQSNRLRLMVKLPSNFSSWAANPIRLWHNQDGTVDTDVSIDLAVSLPNGTAATIAPTSITKSFGDKVWAEHAVTGITGTYAAGDWFCITLTVGAQNNGKVKIGRIDFFYNTIGQS